jgi:hypothetical protein
MDGVLLAVPFNVDDVRVTGGAVSLIDARLGFGTWDLGSGIWVFGTGTGIRTPVPWLRTTCPDP